MIAPSRIFIIHGIVKEWWNEILMDWLTKNTRFYRGKEMIRYLILCKLEIPWESSPEFVYRASLTYFDGWVAYLCIAYYFSVCVHGDWLPGEYRLLIYSFPPPISGFSKIHFPGFFSPLPHSIILLPIPSEKYTWNIDVRSVD